MVIWSDQWFLFYLYSTQVASELSRDAAAAKVIKRKVAKRLRIRTVE